MEYCYSMYRHRSTGRKLTTTGYERRTAERCMTRFCKLRVTVLCGDDGRDEGVMSVV